MVAIGLVYSIYDSTEEAIQKMIEASQRMLKMNSQGELGGMSSPIKKHYELQIKTLQNAPRDADKLERLLQVKEETQYVLRLEDEFPEGYKMGLQDAWSKSFDDGLEEARR